MADPLQEMAVFAKVVAAGSLSAAARELGSSPALVSRRLAALEARLGVRLVNCTTRSLNLTVEGSRYYEACTRVLTDIEEADAEVAAGPVEPPGPLAGGPSRSVRHPHLSPPGAAFAPRSPKVQVDVRLTGRNS